MKLISLEFKNIGSYGNTTHNIEFNGESSDLILIQGKNGNGKCLDPSTEIEIDFSDEETKKSIVSFLNNKRKVTLQELIDFKNSSEKNKKIIESEKIKVNTRYGYYPIQDVAITAKNSEVIEFKLENGISIKSSPGHLFWSPILNDWKKSKEFKVGDILLSRDSKFVRIDEISILREKKDLLDIQVKEVKEFYANGIVSHNSTIAKALKFTLFGKVDGITLKDIPNRINKAAYGKVELIAKNQRVTIERGYAPSLFAVTVNGEPIDQAGKRDVQKYIEEEFLGFNFSVFTNILILSINDFKSFLTMRPSDKRKIIDKIFGFYIINEMKEKVKQEKRELRLSLTRIEEAINQIDSTIKHTVLKLEKIEEKSDQDNKKKVKNLKAEIEDLTKNKTELLDKYTKLKEKVNTLRNQKSQHSSQIAEISERHRTLNKTLKLYENSACPTCQSPLDTPFHKEIIENTKNDIEDIKNKAKSLKEDVESVDKQITKAREFENTLIKNTQKLDSLVDSKKEEIKKFAVANNVNSQELTNLISEFEKQKTTKAKELDKYLENETFLNILEEDVLSDDGVKALAIRAVVPVLNKTVEKFSTSLNSKFNIEFDQSFNCVVKELGEEINPNTLSEGERKKADLIIIIAMIEILKLRYPNMNLMFLDELFSSLDQENIGNILTVLKHMLETLNINIFVISHTELPVQIFDKIIHVFKKGNFSSFNIYDDLTQIPVETESDK